MTAGRALVAGVELDYEVRGSGDPVLLMHAGCLCARWFEPLLGESALTDRFQLVSYDRAGYGQSSRPTGATSTADHAAHARALLGHLGIPRAHVVGHSSSAMMALQLALDAPAAVQSLALLESARPAPESAAQAEFVKNVVQPAIGRYRAGDASGAVDTWMTGVCGRTYRETLERALPGAFQQSVADADTFFGQELRAVQAWSFGPEEARHIDQPVLAVVGTESIPTFAERRELLLAWLPNVQSFDLTGATHLLHAQDPHGVALALAAFFSQHPIGAMHDG